jgi:hypothetical protein
VPLNVFSVDLTRPGVVGAIWTPRPVVIDYYVLVAVVLRHLVDLALALIMVVSSSARTYRVQ